MALTTSRFSIFTSPTFVTALLFTVSTTKGLPFSLWESSLMLTGVSNVVNRAAVVTTAACTKVAQPAELTWLPKHQCDLCNRTYTRFKAMTAHVKTAHQNATWPCSLCNKKFPYPTSLRLHINVHKSLRPYKCGICGHSYRQKKDLEIHETKRSKKERVHRLKEEDNEQ